MNPLRIAVLAALLAACSESSAPQGPADVQVSTDLNPGLVDTALALIARNGGPRGERIPGMHAGVSSLPGAAGAPVRFTALTEPWLKGKVAIPSPTGGMALAHFAALYAAWGPERMEAWLKQLKANEPQIYPTDDEVRQAVVSGRAVVGLAASDEAAKAAASAAHVLLVYPNQKSIGTFVWPTALSVPKTAKNREAAQKLAERLADRSIEQLLVARVPGYLPLRSDIPVPPGVRSASNLVVISVDPARIVSEIGQRKASLAAWAASIPKPLPAGAQAQTK